MKQSLLLSMLLLLLSNPLKGAPIVIGEDAASNLDDLQRIGLAIHNYHDSYIRLPAQYADASGTPLLSWRVAILPFIEEQALWAQFDLTKAWDDPANLPLLDQMPDVFRGASDAPTSTSSRYAVGAGTGSTFNGAEQVRLRDIQDGTSNTLLVGEVEGLVLPWTAPVDVLLDPAMLLGTGGFGSTLIDGAVPFVFADGRVALLPDLISSADLVSLLLRADGLGSSSASTVPYVLPVPASGGLLLTALLFAGWQRARRLQMA